MKILIIDDEKSIRFSLKTSLRKLGLEVYDAETGEEGLELFKAHSPKLAIVDIKLPGIDGIEVLKNMKKLDPNCIVIMITYLGEVRLAVKAMKIGAYDYYTKPFSLKEISQAVENACKYIDMKEQLDKQSYEVELIGKSNAIEEIRSTIGTISRLSMDTCILIQGESGTGKEIVAKLIHKGKGEEKSFIALNCAAIPKTLQESELFGHEKGAFTGAAEKKIGLIGKADGGILFLDEIGEMDLTLQAKLLRVLQEKKYRAVGSVEEVEFNATVIAATNKDLKEEVNKGNFRKDLYYRLNVILIQIPALRERKEEIPLLIQSFLDEYNFKLNKTIAGLDKEAMKVMLNYSWPGNIRELKNAIERICIFCNEQTVSLKDLPKEITESYGEQKEKKSLLEWSEKEIIFSSLEKNEWNILKTAEELEISRSTLRRKIEKYKIERK
ncbi:sigma-54 dependent transcriptional regulator [Proteiniborus sp. MB09-C3]|uniref:sigma-54-dependent transcriptional regulator n=1 Tax=Proteiniborus sp. MB09-C3 TaxID=3050072 RepID=UPI0025540C52|nr:sigma-54 dependent transcriptional regulator [Proteiniborus sp. MB09-C3]WIV13544.1 sigma-54 dependent transcriptional regulator [Proteiniborus sp. MB09-C3]